MAVEAEIVYKDRDTIVAELITAWQARVPDVAVTPDSIIRIWIEVLAASLEGLMLANQLLHDDIFPQTANLLALMRHGDVAGRPMLAGTTSVGTLRFSGAGGTVIPIGTTVAAPSAVDDAVRFVTTALATIPNLGVPTAPTASDGGAGVLPAGLYEYAVSFISLLGETKIGAVSAPLSLGATKQVALTAIPIGGPGTVGRRVYRRLNGGIFACVTTIANNTATTYTDNNASGSSSPVVESTAEAIDVAGQAEDVGADGNVGIGAITSLSDSVQGLSAVYNPLPFTDGSDPEDAEDYRVKLLDWIRNPKTGSLADLEAWAEGIEGVADATAFNNDNLGVTTPGHVTVRVSGPNGSMPSVAVQNAVLADLQARDVAAVTVHVTTFTPKPTNVTVTVTRQTGYALADITTSIQQSIMDYINSIPVGGTVYVAGIYAAVFGRPGVATVVVNTPSADVASTSLEKPTPGTITVA